MAMSDTNSTTTFGSNHFRKGSAGKISNKYQIRDKYHSATNSCSTRQTSDGRSRVNNNKPERISLSRRKSGPLDRQTLKSSHSQYRGGNFSQYRGENDVQCRGEIRGQYKGENCGQYRGENDVQCRGENRVEYRGENRGQYRGEKDNDDVVVSEGYDLYLQYRHVYAGKGGWFRRPQSQKYSYPLKRSPIMSGVRSYSELDLANKRQLHRRREIMKKLSKNLQLKSRSSAVFKEEKNYSDNSTNEVFVNKRDSEQENDKCVVRNELLVRDHGFEAALTSGRDFVLKTKQIGNTDGERKFGSKGRFSRDSSHTSLISDQSAKTTKVGKTGYKEKEKGENFTNSFGIDEHCSNIKSEPNNKLKNQSVAKQVSQLDSKKADQGEDGIYKSNIVKNPPNQWATRCGVDMISRLSLEARTAMDETRRDKVDPDGSLENEERVSLSDDGGSRTEEISLYNEDGESIEVIQENDSVKNVIKMDENIEPHTKECVQIKKITKGKIKCCCPHGQQIHQRKLLQERKTTNEKYRSSGKTFNRNYTAGKSNKKKQQQTVFESRVNVSEMYTRQRLSVDGKDHLKSVTKNNRHMLSNKTVGSQKIIPLSKLREKDIFVITPAGYDSRFTDKKPVLDLDMEIETPEEIRKSATEKCREWLTKCA